MKGTETLRAEHKAIGKMLEVINICAAQIQQGKLEELETIRKSLDFSINFTDRCHHKKEEDLLFPLLVKKGISNDGGPVGEMLSEHQQGRNLLKSIDSNLAQLAAGKNDAAALVKSIHDYTSLLEKHIDKENNILFNMADQTLTDKEQADLYEAFEVLEKEEIGEGVHEQYHHMIHHYIHKFGL